MNDMTGNGWVTLGDSADEEHRLRFPVGVVVDSQSRIYVSEQYHHRLLRLNDMTGVLLATYSPPAATTKPVNKFAGSWICLDSLGRIYTTYDGDHRIARIDDMDGTNRIAFGSEGSGPGEFRYPAGIAVDARGRIYVADFDNFRIVRIDDMDGTSWTSFGGYGTGRGEFINPCGLCLDSQGRIYIADQGNDCIVRIDDMEGTNWTTIGSFGVERRPGQLYAPTGICLDAAGRIYVTQCSSNHAIVRLDDMTGANWTIFGTGGAGFGQFASPQGIFVR